MSRSLDWMDAAACRDHPEPDAFFPSATGNGARLQIAAAQRICRSCPVQIECGEHRGVTGSAEGVWGGSVVRGKHFRSGFLFEHGTEAAYRRHVRAGETPCGACRGASSRARAEREARNSA